MGAEAFGKKGNKYIMNILKEFAILAAVVLQIVGCARDDSRATLEATLYDVIDKAPGTVGIAFVSEKDTITINNGVRFGMMSVFKLHEALAVFNALERERQSIDTVLNISADELDENTWSPMLKDYGKRDMSVSVRELMNYAVTASDNNASNILFSRIVSPQETDRFIKSFAADTSFMIRHTEAEMKRNHTLCYENYTSPLAAALLIGQVFNDDILSPANQEAVKTALCTVTTGQNRIGEALADVDGVLFAHKTGSGYRNECGELTAFNDVAYIRLPDGRGYCLAVMIRDFSGTEDEASRIMADVSKRVYLYSVR